MKKIKFILLILTLFCIVSLTSCNKTSDFNNQDYGKIKYYISGLYICVNNYDEMTISDPNPKIYFDFSSTKDFGKLVTKSGSLDAAVTYSDLGKTVKEENEVKKYYVTSKLKFVNENVNKIKLYLINVDKDNNIIVNEEVSESINIRNSNPYEFLVEFKNNKIKYQLQMKLIFK